MTAARSSARSGRSGAESERIARRLPPVGAVAIWSKAKPATQHDYLTRKDIRAHDVRETASGELVVPLRDARG